MLARLIDHEQPWVVRILFASGFQQPHCLGPDQSYSVACSGAVVEIDTFTLRKVRITVDLHAEERPDPVFVELLANRPREHAWLVLVVETLSSRADALQTSPDLSELVGQRGEAFLRFVTEVFKRFKQLETGLGGGCAVR
jgi:hypothetical protein